jgi:hypothetical protein
LQEREAKYSLTPIAEAKNGDSISVLPTIIHDVTFNYLGTVVLQALRLLPLPASCRLLLYPLIRRGLHALRNSEVGLLLCLKCADFITSFLVTNLQLTSSDVWWYWEQTYWHTRYSAFHHTNSMEPRPQRPPLVQILKFSAFFWSLRARYCFHTSPPRV